MALGHRLPNHWRVVFSYPDDPAVMLALTLIRLCPDQRPASCHLRGPEPWLILVSLGGAGKASSLSCSETSLWIAGSGRFIRFFLHALV